MQMEHSLEEVRQLLDRMLQKKDAKDENAGKNE